MPKIRVNADAFLWAAILLVFVPIRWIMAATAAAAVHELGHLAGILLLRCRIHEISLSPRGAVIHTDPLPPGKELLAALAGPTAGLTLLTLSESIPLAAFCAAVQSIYNLLPVYPSDGGRALYCAAALLRGEAFAGKLRLVAGTVTGCLLLGSVFILTVRFRLGLMPLILLFPMAKGLLPEKYLAKQAIRGYNKGYHI